MSYLYAQTSAGREHPARGIDFQKAMREVGMVIITNILEDEMNK